VGNVIIVRYADDPIIGFELDKDARRFQEAMCDRLREFSLSLHREKTRLIEFGRFAVERRAHRRLGKPETFNFLGFTFICGTSSGGQFQIKRKTRRDRMRAKLKEIKEEMRQRRHHSIPEQGHYSRRAPNRAQTGQDPLEPYKDDFRRNQAVSRSNERLPAELCVPHYCLGPNPDNTTA
jgi:hypothetical protein